MRLDDKSQQLPDAEIAVLRKWIASGAKWPAGRLLDLYEKTTDVRGGRDWWSLQPVVSLLVPMMTTLDLCDSTISECKT